eukprot:5386365-Alexandrium_andersonii.AAC.1
MFAELWRGCSVRWASWGCDYPGRLWAQLSNFDQTGRLGFRLERSSDGSGPPKVKLPGGPS